MPEITRFEGIVISMNFNDHNPPHFHAVYNDFEVMFDLNDGVVAKGTMPARQVILVTAWYELHKSELAQMWDSKQIKRLAPLR